MPKKDDVTQESGVVAETEVPVPSPAPSPIRFWSEKGDEVFPVDNK